MENTQILSINRTGWSELTTVATSTEVVLQNLDRRSPLYYRVLDTGLPADGEDGLVLPPGGAGPALTIVGPARIVARAAAQSAGTIRIAVQRVA